MHHSDILVRDEGLWVGLILVAGRLQPDHQYLQKTSNAQRREIQAIIEAIRRGQIGVPVLASCAVALNMHTFVSEFDFMNEAYAVTHRVYDAMPCDCIGTMCTFRSICAG